MSTEETKEEGGSAEEVRPAASPQTSATSADASPAQDDQDPNQRRWLVACLALLVVGGAFWGYRRWLRPGRQLPGFLSSRGGVVPGGTPAVSLQQAPAADAPAVSPQQAPAADAPVLALLTPLREGGTVANGRITRITGVYQGAVYVSIQAGSSTFVLTISRAEEGLNSMRAGPYALDLIGGPPGAVAMQLSQSVLQVLQANVRTPVPAGLAVR